MKNPEKEFENEMNESFQRYYSSTTMTFKVDFTDEDGREYKLHEGLSDLFDEWKAVSSKWDRMGILFRFWDKNHFSRLEKWQVLERFNNDRYPQKSAQFHKEHLKGDDFKNPMILVALAKTYRLLSELRNAKSIIEYAYNNLPENERVMVEYANILHLQDDEADKQQAHQLINNVLETKISASTESTIGLLNYFCFSADYIDSSIFAALFMTSGDADMESWDRLAEEYYYCPVFRYEHAVKLGAKGDALRAMAKLDSLTKEFPWFKPGLVAMVDAIRKFRVKMNDPGFMEEELKKVSHLISL